MLVGLAAAASWADEPVGRALLASPKHLRSGEVREWSEFPESAAGRRLELDFSAAENDGEQTLRVRQRDVKQVWRVRLNDRDLGELVRDENDMVIALAIPPGALAAENRLIIEAASNKDSDSDDIEVGPLSLVGRPRAETLRAGEVRLVAVDAVTGEPLPCRYTIVGADGALQTVGAESVGAESVGAESVGAESVGAVAGERLAVRPGVVYSANGAARLGLPAGEYTIYAGRGFEYSLEKHSVRIGASSANGPQRLEFRLRREVETPGYVACDTHVHTFTYSRHGDATIDERMITLAGEGIELPIATDHNLAIDYEPAARRWEVRRWFTPVVGDEVTTKVGHFNVFPLRPELPVPDHMPSDWGEILDGIFAAPGVRVAILNHARDVHSGTRPFGPGLFNDAVGENVAGWPLRFNAMELVNSGAVQTDPLQLFHDWLTLLNRGLAVTPVGCSDSHDVARHFVGQGRTYIAADDRDPGAIDVGAAVESFVQGRVLVSYGLLTELIVNDRHRSGETVACHEGPVDVRVRVLGPHWTRVNRVLLFANGELVREEALDPAQHLAGAKVDGAQGILWEGDWSLPRPSQDTHLVALAVGPGIDGGYWRTAKPYQPTSPDWTPLTFGCSGAVWLDSDADGRRDSPRAVADRLLESTRGELPTLLESLRPYDRATAAQAAHLLQASGVDWLAPASQEALRTAAPHVRDGVGRHVDAWRRCQQAQVAGPGAR